MTIWPQVLALLIIALFASVLYIAIRTSKNQAAAKANLAETLGFEAVTARPSDLIQRVEEVYKRLNTREIQVDQVFSKEGWEDKEYLFDVSDAYDQDSEIGSEVFGLISNQLALPHFRLVTLPGMFGESMLGGLVEKALDKVLASAEKRAGMKRIEFPDRPDFDRSVVVFGKDQAAVRELLSGFHPSSYTSSQTPVFIGGVGDFLAVDFSQMGGAGSEQNDLIARYNDFSQIARFFQR